MSLVLRKPGSNTNQAVQPQKMSKRLELSDLGSKAIELSM